MGPLLSGEVSSTEKAESEAARAGSRAEVAVAGEGIPSLSLVLPAYNEEANLRRFLPRVLGWCRENLPVFEILVVDDGSTDGTAEVVEHFARLDPRLRLLRHPRNLGYGAAVSTGLSSARGELVFLTDADGQFDIRELGRFLRLLDGHDAVLGYRSPRRDPFYRLVLAWGWRQLVRWLLGVKVRDVDCAFKLLRRSSLTGLTLRSRGAAVSAELLAGMLKKGCRLREEPVSHFPRRNGRATGARPAVILRALGELLAIKRAGGR
jgi:glycosyltransferase involved in cell wall biosynthesis